MAAIPYCTNQYKIKCLLPHPQNNFNILIQNPQTTFSRKWYSFWSVDSKTNPTPSIQIWVTKKAYKSTNTIAQVRNRNRLRNWIHKTVNMLNSLKSVYKRSFRLNSLTVKINVAYKHASLTTIYCRWQNELFLAQELLQIVTPVDRWVILLRTTTRVGLIKTIDTIITGDAASYQDLHCC